MITEELNETSTEGAGESAIDRLNAEIADLRLEIEGARNTIERLAAELTRLRQRYHVGAEGDF